MSTFLGLAALFWICVFAVLTGVVIYLKRRGVLKTAATAAKQAVATDVTDAVAKVAEPPK